MESNNMKSIKLILALLCALNVRGSKILNIDSGEIEFKGVSDDDGQMPIKDQISLLSKRLEVLTEHRQEDYRMLERSLHSYVQKHLHEHINVDIKRELKDLRTEIKALRQGVSSVNREKMTEWLSSSIKELRTEVSELQESASNLSRTCHQRNLFADDLQTIGDELKTFKLEINAIKSRQEKSEVLLRELREEITEISSRDVRKSFEVDEEKQHGKLESLDYIRSEAEHKLRHYRLLRAQVQELESAQRLLQRRVSELESEKITERLHNVELRQKTIENSNYNLSHEMTSFESSNKKSTLELLEDIAEIETKIDRNIPEIRREITKMEIESAQMSSNQNILKEEDHNMARTIQALAVSISTLQNERSRRQSLDSEINNLKMEVEKIKAADKTPSSLREKTPTSTMMMTTGTHETTGKLNSEHGRIDSTAELIKELENVEEQYRNIVEALPSGCHEIEPSDNGLHMIAAPDQLHPTLTRCIGPWTVVQKRHDGSVDFNRSWEDYAKGFGDPSGELWIGNEMLHHLTKDNCTKLRIIIQDIENKTLYADYDSFYIATREEGYRIDLAGYSGNASNALDYQNHMKFSSIDVDLDISHDHCAGEYEGGWWFSYCSHGNLNGRYNSGVTWYDLANNEWMAVKTTLMMITKRDECLNRNSVAVDIEDAAYISSIEISDSNPSSKVNPTTV